VIFHVGPEAEADPVRVQTGCRGLGKPVIALLEHYERPPSLATLGQDHGRDRG
jgi:hypothetical protein